MYFEIAATASPASTTLGGTSAAAYSLKLALGGVGKAGEGSAEANPGTGGADGVGSLVVGVGNTGCEGASGAGVEEEGGMKGGRGTWAGCGAEVGPGVLEIVL